MLQTDPTDCQSVVVEIQIDPTDFKDEMHWPEFPSREWNGNELFYSIVRLIPISLAVIMRYYGQWDGNTPIMCILRTFPVSCLKVRLSWPQTDIMTEMDRTDRFPSQFIVSQVRDRPTWQDPGPFGPGKVGLPDRLHSLLELGLAWHNAARLVAKGWDRPKPGPVWL